MSAKKDVFIASTNPFDDAASPTNPFETEEPRSPLSWRSASVGRQSSLDEISSASRPESRSSVSSVAAFLARNQHDGPKRVFDFYDATVNLPAVLNDPRKVRPTDFLTRTWGEGFVESIVKPSAMLAHLTIDDFRPYMRCINVREALLKGTQSSHNPIAQARKSSQRQLTPAEVDSVPTIFFSPSFHLENPATFKLIFLFNLSDKDSKKSIRIAQERLQHYLDVVESEIARHVSLRAEAFFSVVTSHDMLQERMDVSLAKVVAIRSSLSTMQKVVVKPSLQTVHRMQKRSNLDRIVRKLETITTIRQTDLTIRLLLSNGDFVGALDLINTTREVLHVELAGLHCFRHLSQQLSEMERGIDKVMSLEFRRALSAHLNRSLQLSTGSQKMLEEERFAAIVTGLLRQRRFNVVDWFREEALSALQATLKHVLITSLIDRDGDFDDGEKEDEEGEESINLPYHLLKSLDFKGLVDLFLALRDPLREILTRIRAAHNVTRCLDVGALSQESRAGGTEDGGLTATDYSRLTTQLQELLFAVGEETQEEIAKILNKSPSWKELKLHNDDLVSLWNVLQDIMRDLETILGVRMTVLNAQLQKLAFAFVGRFHDDRKQKLTLILESERWMPTEVPIEFQLFMENIVAQKTFLVPLPRQRSEESIAANGDASKSPSAVVPYLEICGETFMVVGTVVLLLRMLGEYAALIEKLPSSMSISGDLLQKIVELLRMFNSRTCQLVLGAGAMQSAGLRSITSKNLVLSSRCLQLISIFIPVVKDDLNRQLPPKQQHLIKNFDALLRDFDAHVEEIEKKLVQIFDSQLISNFARWEATVPVPSQAFKQIFTSVKRLYDAVSDMLPQSHLERLFRNLFILFKRRLKQQILKLDVCNDGGPQYGVVSSDISYFRNEVHTLIKLKNISENFNDVWEK